MRAPEQLGQSPPARFKRLTTQISAIDLQQIECAKRGAGKRTMAADAVEDGTAIVVTDDRLAVDQTWRHRQCGYCHCDERKAPGQIVALAGYQRDARVNRGTEVMQGTVKWFDFAKGYGFLVPDAGGPDVFVHITAVERAGLKLVEGLPVEYQIITARGRPAAEDLKSINGSGKSGGK